MDKRNTILSTSRSLFSHFGLKKVTTDDIARKAKVSKATIYKYFKNKEDIFGDVTRLEFERLFKQIRAAVDKETTIQGKFRAHLHTKMEKLHELIITYNVTNDTWGEYWPHVVEYRKQFSLEEKEIVISILELGNKREELDVVDVDLTAHIMVIALKSLEFPWVKEDLKITLSDYINKMIDMMIQGIKRR